MRKVLENIQVIGLGQACMDYLGRINAYPHEDEKVELRDIHMQCGGPASTAMVTLSRLGVKTSFLGSLSNDPAGVEILKRLQEEKVDSTFLKMTPGYTSQSAFILINRKDGKRTIFWHRGTVPHLKGEDVDLSVFPYARVLHVDGLMIQAAQEAAKQAKKREILVVMDAGTMRQGTLDMLGFVDVLIASEHFAVPLVGKDEPHEKVIEALQQWGSKTIIITLGSKGSIGWDGGRVIRQKAFPVDTRDTTGAGDVYHGAYIYGLLKDWEMSKCMRFASATSAMKCREIGAQRGIPTLKEIEKFLQDSSNSSS